MVLGSRCTRSVTRPGSPSASGGVEVDADRQWARAHRVGGAQTQPAPKIVLTEQASSLGRIVAVKDVRRPGSPTASRSGADPDTGVGFDVSDVVGPMAVLGDKPKRRAVQSVADRCPVRLPRVSAYRFQLSVPGGASPSRQASRTGGLTMK